MNVVAIHQVNKRSLDCGLLSCGSLCILHTAQWKRHAKTGEILEMTTLHYVTVGVIEI